MRRIEGSGRLFCAPRVGLDHDSGEDKVIKGLLDQVRSNRTRHQRALMENLIAPFPEV